MKKTLSIIGFAGLIFAIGCAKLKSLTTINIDLPTYTNQIYLPSVYDTLRSHFPAGGVLDGANTLVEFSFRIGYRFK